MKICSGSTHIHMASFFWGRRLYKSLRFPYPSPWSILLPGFFKPLLRFIFLLSFSVVAKILQWSGIILAIKFWVRYCSIYLERSLVYSSYSKWSTSSRGMLSNRSARLIDLFSSLSQIASWRAANLDRSINLEPIATRAEIPMPASAILRLRGRWKTVSGWWNSWQRTSSLVIDSLSSWQPRYTMWLWSKAMLSEKTNRQKMDETEGVPWKCKLDIWGTRTALAVI